MSWSLGSSGLFWPITYHFPTTGSLKALGENFWRRLVERRARFRRNGVFIWSAVGYFPIGDRSKPRRIWIHISIRRTNSNACEGSYHIFMGCLMEDFPTHPLYPTTPLWPRQSN